MILNSCVVPKLFVFVMWCVTWELRYVSGVVEAQVFKYEQDADSFNKQDSTKGYVN